MKLKKTIAIALLCAMTAAALPLTAHAEAVDAPTRGGEARQAAAQANQSTGEAAIQLGTQGIEAGDFIYYGVWEGEEIQWRVLDPTQTSMGTDGMFLLSEYILNNERQFNMGTDNTWVRSTAQIWCDTTFANGSFDTAERAAIMDTNKTDNGGTFYGNWYGSSTLTNSKAFFLSAEEASTYLASATSSTDLKTELIAKKKSDGKAWAWWLRSPSGTTSVPLVNDGGGVRPQTMGQRWGYRPAFNLNTDAVLFSSAAAGGKSSDSATVDADGLEPVDTTANDATTEWKLTLKDETRNFAITSAAIDADKATVNYSGAKTGTNEYISAIIQNSAGQITYYGRVAQSSAETGTVSINLTGKMNTGDTLYVFNEQCNTDADSKETDYASELLKVTNTPSTYTVTNTLTNITSNGAADATEGTDYTATLTAEQGYLLPQTIEVKVGNQTLASTDYTYNPDTGALTIPGAKLTGDVEIIAAAIQQTYGLSASPSSLAFASAEEGYTAAPAAQTVTITNTGNQTVTLNQPTSANYTVGTLSQLTLAPDAEATFTVQPKTGLAEGSYAETIAVTGSDGTAANVSVTFTVTAKDDPGTDNPGPEDPGTDVPGTVTPDDLVQGTDPGTVKVEHATVTIPAASGEINAVIPDEELVKYLKGEGTVDVDGTPSQLEPAKNLTVDVNLPAAAAVQSIQLPKTVADAVSPAAQQTLTIRVYEGTKHLYTWTYTPSANTAAAQLRNAAPGAQAGVDKNMVDLNAVKEPVNNGSYAGYKITFPASAPTTGWTFTLPDTVSGYRLYHSETGGAYTGSAEITGGVISGMRAGETVYVLRQKPTGSGGGTIPGGGGSTTDPGTEEPGESSVTLDTQVVYMINDVSLYDFLVEGNNDTGNITVTSSDENVATVALEDGADTRGAKYRVTTHGTGEATITVTYNGESTTMDVVVYPKGGSITLDTVNYRMAPGNVYDIGVTVTDGNGTALSGEQVQQMVQNGTLRVTDSRTGSVVSLEQLANGNFRVTGRNAGTCWITYEVFQNNEAVARASVRVDVEAGAAQGGVATRDTSWWANKSASQG